MRRAALFLVALLAGEQYIHFMEGLISRVAGCYGCILVGVILYFYWTNRRDMDTYGHLTTIGIVGIISTVTAAFIYRSLQV